MTDAIRQELAPRGIHVTAVHVGYIDTDMAAFAPADQKERSRGASPDSRWTACSPASRRSSPTT